MRWRHESNRGFLRSLDALRQAAGAIGESDEEQRCDLFLRQLDPEWGSSGQVGGTLELRAPIRYSSRSQSEAIGAYRGPRDT